MDLARCIVGSPLTNDVQVYIIIIRQGPTITKFYIMNILIPDSWLREYLKTDATPSQIKEWLSLSGPSVERINTVNGDAVYDIEITTNRVDAYSVYGIAREASVILPQFDCPAKLLPLKLIKEDKLQSSKALGIKIVNDQKLCQRILAIKLENIKLGESPDWMKDRLEKVGQRALNNAVDITNYVMWEIGHPVHVFDFDRIVNKTIIIREAKKGETLTTLDGNTHTLIGGEIIFEDGNEEIIDMPGIMGTANTVVTKDTKNVLLFIENSDPQKIRYASMTHGIRTQAAIINEKHPDPELALTAMKRSIELFTEVTHGMIASNLTDIYDSLPPPPPIYVSQSQIDIYLSINLQSSTIINILSSLGCQVKTIRKDHKTEYQVTPPTWRRFDMTIPEDVIEEIARIYGYHSISTVLPCVSTPPLSPDPILEIEENLKIKLRDWNYTELYTYSMISAKQMDMFGFEKTGSLKITNPLTSDHVYMRPSLLPGVLDTVSQNLHHRDTLSLFELSNIYISRTHNLPEERSSLIVLRSGMKFLELKGLAEKLFKDQGIKFPQNFTHAKSFYFDTNRSLSLEKYGNVGVLNPELLHRLEIKSQITILELDLLHMLENIHHTKIYQPISKYPPVVEDLSFIIPGSFQITPFMERLKSTSPLITSISLMDMYDNSRTIRIEYTDPDHNLTIDEIAPIREKIIKIAQNDFGAELKR